MVPGSTVCDVESFAMPAVDLDWPVLPDGAGVIELVDILPTRSNGVGVDCLLRFPEIENASGVGIVPVGLGLGCSRGSSPIHSSITNLSGEFKTPRARRMELVLLADDSKLSRDILQRLLNRLGYVYTAFKIMTFKMNFEVEI